MTQREPGFAQGKRSALFERGLLHPGVRDKIREIRGARRQRLGGAVKTGAEYVLAGGFLTGGAETVRQLVDQENGLRADLAVSPLLLASSAGLVAYFTGRAAFRAGKASSAANKEYLWLHRELGKRIREGKIFNPEKVGNAAELEEQLRNKFNYWFVDGKGRLHFTNNKRFLELFGRKRGRT